MPQGRGRAAGRRTPLLIGGETTGEAQGGEIAKPLAARVFGVLHSFYILVRIVYNLLSPCIRCGYKMKRDEQVNIRMTQFEYWRAYEACQYLDVTMSQVCRKALREVAAVAVAKGWNPEIPIELQAMK